MHELWPLFQLRVETSRVSLRLPIESEIARLATVAADGVHQPHERPFLNPWAEGSPTDRARFVLQEHWSNLGSWSVDDWQLGLGVFVDGEPVGMATIRASDFPVDREVNTSSWLGIPHQGQGTGTAARIAVLSLVFDALDATSALSHVFADNHASQAVSRKLGYVHDGITTDRRGEESVISDRLRMTHEVWETLTGPEATVSGFETCRPMFGLD